MSIAFLFFNYPHCVDSFAFDFQKLKFPHASFQSQGSLSWLPKRGRGGHERIFGDSQRRPGEISVGTDSGNLAARPQDQRRGDSPEHQASLRDLPEEVRLATRLGRESVVATLSLPAVTISIDLNAFLLSPTVFLFRPSTVPLPP